MYQYNARVVRWIDGDTVELLVDLGFHVGYAEHFRLFNVGTAERNTPEGKVAAARVNELAPPGSPVVVDTRKASGAQQGRTFTRWLAAVQLPDGRDLSAVLLSEGLATPYKK